VCVWFIRSVVDRSGISELFTPDPSSSSSCACDAPLSTPSLSLTHTHTHTHGCVCSAAACSLSPLLKSLVLCRDEQLMFSAVHQVQVGQTASTTSSFFNFTTAVSCWLSLSVCLLLLDVDLVLYLLICSLAM